MQGTFVYSFSVFAKVDTMLRIDPSYIEIGLVIDTAPICGVAGYPCLNQKKIYDSIPAVWSKITLIDTITSNASDSIAVVLSAGALPVGILVYYDLAELTVTDTLALSENIELMPMPAIKVTPNPFNDHTIIEFNNKPYSLIQFTLFSMSGQIIRQITTSTGKINLERSDLSSGMYFYQALDYHTKELRGRGKIILQE